MADKIEELKKLAPEERIKKIKEIEEKLEKEKKLIEEMLRESLLALKKEEALKRVKVPEPDRVNIDELFKPAVEDNSVESIAKEADSQQRVSGLSYRINLEEAESLYREIREMGSTDQWGSEEFKEFYRVQAIVEAVDTRLVEDDVAERVNSTRSLINIIRQYLK